MLPNDQWWLTTPLVHRTIERRVRVMAQFINLVDKGWPLIAPRRVRAVAERTVGGEQASAGLRVFAQLRNRNRIVGLVHPPRPGREQHGGKHRETYAQPFALAPGRRACGVAPRRAAPRTPRTAHAAAPCVAAQRLVAASGIALVWSEIGSASFASFACRGPASIHRAGKLPWPSGACAQPHPAIRRWTQSMPGKFICTSRQFILLLPATGESIRTRSRSCSDACPVHIARTPIDAGTVTPATRYGFGRNLLARRMSESG